MSWKEKQIFWIALHFSLQNYNDWLWSITDGSLPQTVINPQLSSQGTCGVEAQVKPLCYGHFILFRIYLEQNMIQLYFYAKVCSPGTNVQCNFFSAFQVSAKPWTWPNVNWQVWSQVCSAKLPSPPIVTRKVPQSNYIFMWDRSS